MRPRVPTRRGCAAQGVCRGRNALLVRLNLDQSLVPASLDAIGIGGHGALEAIRKLDALIREKRGANATAD